MSTPNPSGSDVLTTRLTLEMMQRALRHAFHRDHGHKEFCDACTESKALLTLAAESFPDMLAALKQVEQIFKINGVGIFRGKPANDILAAIAKAEGR